MNRQSLTVLLVAAAVVSLTACSAPAAPVEEAEVEEVVAIPADFDGSWVLTRTVEATDNAEQPVGSESTRYITFTVGECSADSCEGTLAVGSEPDQKVEYPYVQEGDVITYDIAGADDCVLEDGTVVLAAAFEYEQHIELTAAEKDGDTVTAIGGTSLFTYATIDEAESFGCPVQTGSTEYSYSGVRE